MKSKPTLSILIPSKREAISSFPSICKCAQIACPEIELVISDNSGEDIKRQALQLLFKGIPNITILNNHSNTTLYENYLLALNAASAPYIAICADDDIPDQRYYSDAVRKIQASTRAQCIHPKNFLVNHGTHISIQPTIVADIDNWKDSILHFHYSKKPPQTAYSVYPKEMLCVILRYIGEHPFKPNYTDWLTEYYLRANCKFITTSQGYYLYDYSNWADQQSINRSDQAFWESRGFPAWFTVFHHLIWAVDIGIFLSTQALPGTEEENLLVAGEIFSYTIKEFIRLAKTERNHYLKDAPLPPQVMLAVEKIINTQKIDISDAVDLLTKILSLISEEKTQAYITFLEKTISGNSVL